MTMRTKADSGSLSFKDRSLSQAAAKELFDVKAASALGNIIDTAVVRIRNAKAIKAEKATDAYFAHRGAKFTFSNREGKSVRNEIKGSKFAFRNCETA